MKLNRLGGITASADTTLHQSDKVEALFVASGAIGSGSAVCVATSNLEGKLVVEGTTSIDHAVSGIYEGLGQPSGAADSSYGGHAAVDGDIISVTVFGLASKARVNGGTVDVLDGSPLSCTTNGEVVNSGALDVGVQASLVALEANAGTAAPHPVLVRCM